MERAVETADRERVRLALKALIRADAVLDDDGLHRLAKAYAAAVGDPAAPLQPAWATALMVNAGPANGLFAATGFVDAVAAIEALAPAFDGKLSQLPPDRIARVLGLLSLDVPAALDAEDSFHLDPQTALVRALSLVQTPPLTPLGAARREAVLAGARALDGVRLEPTLEHVGLAAAAWMICSYAAHPDRHALKAVLNRAFLRLLAEMGLQAPANPADRAKPQPPTLVVIAEVIHAQHVQFRYFGQYLRQLRSRFRLVLVTPRRELGPEVEALFDEVAGFDPAAPAFLGELVNRVRSAAPDVVFWPSVGMARWGPLLANLRLGPIQITALGHSASTFAPAMDYYLTEEGYVSDPRLFSERLLLLPDESLRFERPPGYRALPPSIRPVARPVKVAVPSNLLKLNPGFLAVLQRVQREAGRPIELHLFPNAGPLAVAALKAASPLLEDATVHERLDAPAYLAALNACDLVLSPFPFGGLHSVVDALRQGLPVVAMEGAEPHARTDAMILRRLGMPEWLAAHTEADYVAAALRLINDDALRVEVSERALACRIDEVMFGDAATPLGSEVVDAVWAVYQAHEQVRAEPRRAWTLEALRALG